jgi:uncharacterized membrane protein YfcA
MAEVECAAQKAGSLLYGPARVSIRRVCNAHATRAILCAFTAPPSPRPAHVVLFHLLLALVAIVAGGIAAVSGFGIGSLLTPTLAVAIGTKLAVAAIASPHFVATVIGTALGTRVLGHLPPRAFRHVIGVLLVALGVYMIVAGGAH